jgi:hypothetical protein
VAALIDPTPVQPIAANAAGESSITQTALIAVIVLLVAVLIGLAAMVVVLRRRARDQSRPAPPASTPAPPPPIAARPRVRQVTTRSRGGGTAGGLAVATSTASAMVCPTCRSEYDGHMYCLRDARRLIPAEEMLGGQRSTGLFCAQCRRAFEPGLRRCPHDGSDLMPAALYWASRPKRARPKTEPTGVIGRICPVCRGRYDLAARFCGVDGAELVVIN